MPMFHLQVFLAGIPNDRAVDQVQHYTNKIMAERVLGQLWNRYGSSRHMATLTRIKLDGDLELLHQIGPFKS